MENCPKCQGFLHVGNNFISVTGDESPDTTTEIFMNLPRICINEDCEQKFTVVETQKHKIY